MSRQVLDTHQKALQINLDKIQYGTFAEIGAGQEVVRWFFRVGGASGTIAKAMSAYDMTFSDAIYGPSPRYVSRERLQTMLDHEYGLLVERLAAKRGSSTRFFVFADTVTARSYTRRDDAHGWLGIRFQSGPLTEPSQIMLHVRMWDKENLQQQEALGALGVNLVHGALYLHPEPETLLVSLVDNLGIDRVEVDMIEFSGPAFTGVDNRLTSLKLVQGGLTNATMFTADGRMVQPYDELYGKCILVERGTFRPVTRVTLDMLRCAGAQFVQEPHVQGEEVVTLVEMTVKHLTEGDTMDHHDFLDRVDLLRALGKTVLISNFLEYHRLAAYFFRHTKQMIGVVLGLPSLQEIFQERYYTDLAGGILESFGRMFKHNLKLYVYPALDTTMGAIITAGNLRVAPHLQHLHSYLIENRLIEGIRGYDESCLAISSQEVLRRIRSGDPSWEQMVPPQVAALIHERKLFGCQS